MRLCLSLRGGRRLLNASTPNSKTNGGFRGAEGGWEGRAHLDKPPPPHTAGKDLVFPERYTVEYKYVCKHNEIFVFENCVICCDFCLLDPVFERIISAL